MSNALTAKFALPMVVTALTNRLHYLKHFYGNQPLSNAEMYALEAFLLSCRTSEETMSISCMDGYLTALALSQVDRTINDWLPIIWGGKLDLWPNFSTGRQAQQVISLILRRKRSIENGFKKVPFEFAPIFDYTSYPKLSREFVDGEMWATGFMTLVERETAAWEPIFNNEQATQWTEPIRWLGASSLTASVKQAVATPAQREILTGRIPDAVANLHRFWKQHKYMNVNPRINQLS
jgi:uncharacterized protein